MNAVEAAARLGVHESQVRSVEECEAGHKVLLRSGVLMLVSETTARVFVPEVDEPGDIAAENKADREALIKHLTPQEPKKTQRKGKAGGSGG